MCLDAKDAFISSIYFFASLMKLQIMIIMIIPIGNAEMILTDWILLIELSENTRAIGNTISKTESVQDVAFLLIHVHTSFLFREQEATEQGKLPLILRSLTLLF